MFIVDFDDSNSGPAISIGVGITVGLLAAFIQSLGLTIQRKSHVLNQEAPEHERKVEHRRPLWLFGFGIFISSNILGSIFQIASLPVVILAPLGAVSLLWNALFARLILGDDFSRFMVLGTLLIVAGAVLIARFGIVPEPTHSLEDLLALFRRDAFVVYFSLLGAAVLIVLVVTHIAEWSINRRIRADARSLIPGDSDDESSDSGRGVEEPIPLTPSRNGFPSERTPLLDRKATATPSSIGSAAGTSPLQTYRATFNLLAVSYASASGIISGMCLIFAKSGVELLVLTVTGRNQFYRWESWALVGALGICALLQLWYLHKSLILADPTLVCPLSFCFYNVSTIFNGLIYYNQLKALTPLHLGLVGLGIAVLLIGVYAVSIQTEDDDRRGDWVPVDEAGVGPAVAPADVVRIAEIITGTVPSEDHGLPPDIFEERRARTLPAQQRPLRPPKPYGSLGRKAASVDFQLGLPDSGSPPPSVSPLTEDFPTLPPPPSSASSAPAPRLRPRRPHPQLPPLRASGVPQYTALLSPEEPTPVIPGLSIGLSAVSPGWPTVLRKKRSHLSDGPGTLGYRRAVSDSFGWEWLRERRRLLLDRERERRRRPSVVESQDERDGEDHGAGHSEEAGIGKGGRGWVWRLAAWRPGRRKEVKPSSPGDETN